MTEHQSTRARGVAAVPSSSRYGGPWVLAQLSTCAPMAPDPPVPSVEGLSYWTTLMVRQTHDRHRPELGHDGSLRCPACLAPGPCQAYRFAADTLGLPSLRKLPLE